MTMRHHVVPLCHGLLYVAACSAMALAGCDDGQTRLDSGVAGDKALSQLTEGELAEICDATVSYAETTTSESRAQRAQCIVLGLSEGTVPQCKLTSAECLRGADASSDGDFDEDGYFGDGGESDLGSCAFPPALLACDASVDVLEGCLQAALMKAAALLDQISCDLLANGADFAARAAAVPSACAALDRSCPGLGTELSRLDDGSGDGASPPRVEATCPALDIEYDGQGCTAGSASCPPVSCKCGQTSPLTFAHCNAFRGCMTALDCDVVCADDSIINTKVRQCATSASCQSDADCGQHRCALSGSSGSCTWGAVDDACDEDGDCVSGKCGSLGSRMVCSRYGGTGSECTRDDECESGICYRREYIGPGHCSDGSVGAACTDDEQCVSGPCVLDSIYDFDGLCTDRTLGSRCNSPSHCESGFCVYTEEGQTCQAGGVGDPCEDDNDCDGGFCVDSNLDSELSICQAGAPGDSCDFPDDCVSGICILSDDEDDDEPGACGYPPGAVCPDGIADCDGLCSLVQGTCGSDNCNARCGGGACTEETLAEWNPDDRDESIGLSGGNLVATSFVSLSTYDGVVRATIGKDSGKWYWEITITNDDEEQAGIGVSNAWPELDWGLGDSNFPSLGFFADGTIDTSNEQDDASACRYAEGNVVGVALDASLARVYFSLNGAWLAGSDPGSGTGGRQTGLAGVEIYPAVSPNGSVLTANFGQSVFKYPPPAGYSVLF